MKAPKVVGPTVRELKAAAVDIFVKQELAIGRAAQASKMARLKALRLARDAAENIDIAPKAHGRTRRRPTLP